MVRPTRYETSFGVFYGSGSPGRDVAPALSPAQRIFHCLAVHNRTGKTMDVDQTVLNDLPAPEERQPQDAVAISLDAFVRSIGVRRASPFALFLGAGFSTTSGVPSAQMCIWEWKRRIFLTNNPGLEEQFAELSLDGVRRRIQRWLDARGISRARIGRGVRLLHQRMFPDPAGPPRLFFRPGAQCHPPCRLPAAVPSG